MTFDELANILKHAPCWAAVKVALMLSDEDIELLRELLEIERRDPMPWEQTADDDRPRFVRHGGNFRCRDLPNGRH